MACYAGNHVIGRAVHNDMSPVGLSFWRWFCGLLILTPFVWRSRKVLWADFARDRALFALLGFLVTASTTLVLVGLNYTTASNTSLINAVQPTLTAILCWLWLNERLSAVQWGGVFVAFAGISLMICRGQPSLLLQLDFNRGDLLVLAAMFGFATYALNIRRIPTHYSSVQSLYLVIFCGVLWLLPPALMEAWWLGPVALTVHNSLAIVALALLVSVGGMLLWTRGNQLVGPNRAAVYMNLLPVFGAGMAIAFLGERLQWFHLVGAVAVALGMSAALRRPQAQ